MIEVDWVKSTGHKKAYKNEVPIKISQKARFEKNYIVWKPSAVANHPISTVRLRRTI